MTMPVFGLTFSRSTTEPVAVIGADFSKVLIIETSSDADPAKYPINQPVRISTGDAKALEQLGGGLLYDYVRGVGDQLSDLNAGADAIIVRVAEGADDAKTSANIVKVLNEIDTIPPKVNATPRIVLAGRTAWRPPAVKNARRPVNPVIAALEAALPKIMAMAPVDIASDSLEASIDDRETMTSERIIPIGVQAKVWLADKLEVRPMAPRVAGLLIRVDNQNQGYPFEPIANRPIFGLAGLSRPIPFSLLDGSSEGQKLLAANVSLVGHGETGVDGALTDGGFTFIGTDNAQTGELWSQFHQVRGADYIVTELIKITKQVLGKNLSAPRVEAWLTSVAFALRDHRAAGRIIGYAPRAEMFKPSENSPENIRLGELTISIAIEPASSFKVGHHNIARYRPALKKLVGDILAATSSAI